MKHESLEQHWAYNCEDTVRTYECAEVEKEIIKKFGLEGPEAFQQSMFWPVLRTMIRGVRIDLEARDRMAREVAAEKLKRSQYFESIFSHPLNPNSSKQMMALFYEDLQQPVIMTRGKKGAKPRPTLDDEALQRLGSREPILRPIVKAISEYRTLGVFLSTFINAPLDEDGRLRCSYNICGTETYRLSSKENAFGTGTNLQNVPKGTGKSRHSKDIDELALPNIRRMFIPDHGYTFFDGDLDRADLQVVVREIDDHNLRRALELGIDMHCMNACEIFKIAGIPYDELTETHPNYKEHRARIGELKRHSAKEGCHAVNYGVKPPTFSKQFGVTIHEAGKFITAWLDAHPGLKRWHTETDLQLKKRRFVENRFGYRRFYFGRVESLLPEALAWIPQSTVAITVNRIWLNLYEQAPWIDVLLQVHDSLAGQVPMDREKESVEVISAAAKVEIPYDPPLVIPFGLKTSPVSWGDCQ